MLKNIATARSECTRNESMTSYNTDYTVPDLTEFIDDDCTRIRKRIEKKYIYICEKHYTD